MPKPLDVVLVKPSKYQADGYVERFRKGFMPNSTLPYLRSLTQKFLHCQPSDIRSIDEYVHTDTEYLSELVPGRGAHKLVALVGVQSHQYHRALDLADIAVRNGCMAIIGGPHAMTCNTEQQQGLGVSFCLGEAELVWEDILSDAARGQLAPVYGADERWQKHLDSPVVTVSKAELKRYVVPMLGVYPARGCPYSCNFCSVVKIAGHRIRSQTIDVTMATLRAAKAAGVKTIMFTSDNFNKYPEASDLLNAVIDEKLGLRLFVQCDTQVYKQEPFFELLGKAGCHEMFVGAESFDRKTLTQAGKMQNHPEAYARIVELCRANGIGSHFSNIIGFPSQGIQEIREHVAALKQLAPTSASFYVLCPIPGTEQYEEFLNSGMIAETNLDRFDGTGLTWNHPNLSAEQLEHELFSAYKQFFSLAHTVSNLRSGKSSVDKTLRAAAITIGSALFYKWSATCHTHPMSGGLGRVSIDHVDDHLPARVKRYGVKHVPLPKNLPLPEPDRLFNKNLNPRLNAELR